MNTSDNTQHFLLTAQTTYRSSKGSRAFSRLVFSLPLNFFHNPNINSISPFLFSCYKHHISPEQEVKRLGSATGYPGSSHCLHILQATPPHCQAPTEDPHHFLFICPFYSHLRDRYPDMFQGITSVEAFLAKTNSSRTSAYLSHCLKLHTNSFNTVT